MHRIQILLILFISILFQNYSLAQENKTTGSEILSVQYYENLTASLPTGIAAKLNISGNTTNSYKSFYAKNNGSLSLKKKTNPTDYSTLAYTAFENGYATNSTLLNGPGDHPAAFELLSSLSKKGHPDKVYFSEIAFIDSSTVVTIAYTKKKATLLIIDINSNPMNVNAAINIPVTTALFNTQKELFSINPVSKKIIIPVQKMDATVSKESVLEWKKKNNSLPGIWIITPVKNDEKKWTADKSSISVRYFENKSLKRNLVIQNAHEDNAGNIWMSFDRGIIGVLPSITYNKTTTYAEQVSLYNFNKEVSHTSEIQQHYKELLYKNLKNTIDTETQDTANFKKQILQHPEAFANQYLEAGRYNLFSKILRGKEALLDSNAVYENSESLWQYVHLQLDPPTGKRKNRLTDYFGFKIKSLQSLQNGITSGEGNSILVATNSSLNKLEFNSKTNSIQLKWSTDYENSYFKTEGQKTSSSLTTPVYIPDKNEVVFCDNAFPQINLLILDAKTGNLTFKAPLFEYNYGSACENAVAYADNTIIVGNTFGNSNSIKSDALAYPANGIMRFNCSTTGKWTTDYVWNKNQANTPTNSAAPKISVTDNKVYVYHNNEGQWEISAIRLDKTDSGYPLQFSLIPDFQNIGKTNIANYKNNFTFGPKKTIFVGTKTGLLRIATE